MNNPLNDSLVRFMACVYLACSASSYTGCGEKNKLSQQKKDSQTTIDAVVENSSRSSFEKKCMEDHLWIKETTVFGEEVEFTYSDKYKGNI
ncbi:hypothetical protein HY484_01530, partial [Candidatus Woesearchaeota archaeon]|nr:hypothetical protein [Candidatus Woesearchaeota archaeon]